MHIVICQKFGEEMLDQMRNEETFLDNVIFSDTLTLHINGNVNSHNCGETPYAALNHVYVISKVNVFVPSVFKVYSF